MNITDSQTSVTDFTNFSFEKRGEEADPKLGKAKGKQFMLVKHDKCTAKDRQKQNTKNKTHHPQPFQR